MALAAAARLFATKLIDGLYPPQCLYCGVAVESAHGLCGSCWGRMGRITTPYCARLGVPFDYKLGEGAISPQAIANPPDYDWALSAVAYEDVARGLVGNLKYRDRHEVARFMGQLMSSSLRQDPRLLFENAVIVPVPLHARRQWGRRFNQSLLLANHLGKTFGCEVKIDYAYRRRNTPQQVGLSSAQRKDNVRGAFEISDEFVAGDLAGPLILVDDVVTTGATVNALARAFKQKGASQIGVLSFARVVP